MPNRLYRSIAEPIRAGLAWDERWTASDRGLIWNWEHGRELRADAPDLAKRAENGELVRLSWKGGTEQLKPSEAKMDGSLAYLAQWQGLRGQDLDIDLDAEIVLVCTVRKRSKVFRK